MTNEATDQQFLLAAIASAQAARDAGNHPFGAVLVGPDGKVLLEGRNTVLTSRDVTGHAELNLVREATKIYTQDFLWTCTLYASTEPCMMCSGSIYWANIGRVVYAVSAERLYQLVKDPQKNSTHRLTCRQVFEYGVKPVQVSGPISVPGAEAVHAGFWD